MQAVVPLHSHPVKRLAAKINLVPIGLISICAGLIYAQFHLFGNTTERYLFGGSAFNWMLMLWKSGRIFGGNIYYLGWIMPVVTLILLYRRRRQLAFASRVVYWPGLMVVIAAIFLHWAGARAQQTRLSLIAFILLLWAIPLFLYGRSFAKQIAFPVTLLFFCVPLNFLDTITFPMRVLSATVAQILAAGLGFVVERAGSVIRLVEPVIALNGADPASGLGTLLSLAAASLVIGAWRPDGWPIRCMLPLLVIPLMLITGSLRLLLGIVLANFISPEIASSFHDRAGLPLMLGLPSLALFFVRSWMLSRSRIRPGA